MHFSFIISILVSTIFAQEAVRYCASVVPEEEKEINERRFQSIVTSAGLNSANLGAFSTTIDVYFHIIQSSTGEGACYISQVNDQLASLNNAYKQVGLIFRLGGEPKAYQNDAWYNIQPGGAAQTAMKDLLHMGGSKTLNVYFTAIGEGILGYATFPKDYKSNPRADGVVINTGTLPRGAMAPYNLGATLIHEVGHWAGLYHTFQGGCDGNGDFVSDTPAQASASSGCPVGRNSCSGAGLDPINNYMDYTVDSCMNQFTPGQAERMAQQIQAFRL
jgi:hypothetical protein